MVTMIILKYCLCGYYDNLEILFMWLLW